MALTWLQFRTTLRRTFLQDETPNEETNEFRYSDDLLLDCVRAALDAFCAHTSVATATGFAPATGLTFSLPGNALLGDLTWPGLNLYYVNPSNNLPVYLDPVRNTPGMRLNGTGYYIRPESQINLNSEITDGASITLYLEYYAHYNHPTLVTDTIDIPQWARTAVSYLTCGYALSSYALKASSIRQWNSKTDSGTPIQNPMQEQMALYMKMYEKEIARFPIQDRSNNFRNV